MTRVYMQIPVRADRWHAFERFVAPPETWLPAPVQPAGRDRWLTRAHVGRFAHPILVHVARPWRLPDARSRHIRWEPHDANARLPRDRMLPTFVGQLTLRFSAASGLWLELNGSYIPPGGRVGESLDRAALHRAGDATVRRFLHDVATRLTEAPVTLTVAASPG